MKPHILIFCLFATAFSLSQDSLPAAVRLNVGVRFNRLDFFSEASLLLPKDKITHEIGLGFGINRSVFQQRVFPELFYALQSNFKYPGIFYCQAAATYHFSFFQVNREQSEVHFFNELLIGPNLSFGRKNRVYLQPQIGLQSESFHSDLFQRVETVFSFGYSAKIGFTHAF